MSNKHLKFASNPKKNAVARLGACARLDGYAMTCIAFWYSILPTYLHPSYCRTWLPWVPDKSLPPTPRSETTSWTLGIHPPFFPVVATVLPFEGWPEIIYDRYEGTLAWSSVSIIISSPETSKPHITRKKYHGLVERDPMLDNQSDGDHLRFKVRTDYVKIGLKISVFNSKTSSRALSRRGTFPPWAPLLWS